MKQQSLTISAAWRTALQVRGFKIKLITGIALLLFCAWLAPLVFQYAQQRTGVFLADFVLRLLPATDLSLAIFIIMDTLLIVSIAALLTRPHHLLIVLHAYVLLTLVRLFTILIVPLEPPDGFVLLHDPVTDRFFYKGQAITKDLFFSGHTSVLVLMGLGLPFPRLKFLLFAGAALVGFMLLVQHAHYTIDILAAPAFAWLAIVAGRKMNGIAQKNLSDNPLHA